MQQSDDEKAPLIHPKRGKSATSSISHASTSSHRKRHPPQQRVEVGAESLLGGGRLEIDALSPSRHQYMTGYSDGGLSHYEQALAEKELNAAAALAFSIQATTPKIQRFSSSSLSDKSPRVSVGTPGVRPLAGLSDANKVYSISSPKTMGHEPYLSELAPLDTRIKREHDRKGDSGSDDEDSSSTSSRPESDIHETEVSTDKLYKGSLDFDAIAVYLSQPSHTRQKTPTQDTLSSEKSKKKGASPWAAGTSRVLFYSDKTGSLGAKRLESLNFTAWFQDHSNERTSDPSLGTTATLDSPSDSLPQNPSFSLFLSNLLQSAPFWIDICNPSPSEMSTFRKLFGIHPLTIEDIEADDSREKCEVFPNYFYVIIRTFDSDPYSMSYLHPINISLVVYRQCILSFHRRPIPHPHNVLKRIEQLKPYGLTITPDWINYAIIDDITDSFMPLLRYVEFEVESIDELVLILNESEQSDMLRRIGKARKNVLLLMRLLSTKSDVLKNIIKRCAELMTSDETCLYLGDIQDHVFTMVQNLAHYEKTLARSHSNYLAQISIELTQASNRTNDVVMKMTALASLLVPMNVLTGLWGMNVLVPWQDTDSFIPFFGIISVMIVIALVSFIWLRKHKLW